MTKKSEAKETILKGYVSSCHQDAVTIVPSKNASYYRCKNCNQYCGLVRKVK